MREIGHFIGGKHVAGTSGKFGDVFNPASGEVTAQGRHGRRLRGRQGRRRRQRRLAGLGQHPAAAPRPRHVQAEGTAGARPPGDVGHHHRGARQGPVGCRRRGAARAGGRRIRLRHPASAEGRIHRPGRHRHRRLVDPPAAGRRRRHHAVQLPDHGAAVDDPGGARLRQLLHPEAVGEGSVGLAETGGAAEGGRPAGRRVQRRAGRAGGGREHPRPSRHRRDQLRRLHRDRRDDLSRRHLARQARAGAGRGEEPPGGDAGRRHRRRGRCADGVGLRRGRRALHGGLRCGDGRVGRRRADGEAGAPGAGAEGGAGRRSGGRDGAAGDPRAPGEGARLRGPGRARRAPIWWSTAAG